MSLHSSTAEVEIETAGDERLGGSLAVPKEPIGVVAFAHGTGSSRFSPRNRFVADSLNASGIATLLVDLLTKEEERAERATGHLRFDIELLAQRLGGSLDWLKGNETTKEVPIGLFGASTGAAAALALAAARPEEIHAIVSRGGRPDLAGEALRSVRAPTLLIVGGADPQVLDLNRKAASVLADFAKIEVIPGASHLFEEPGALEQVARLASDWFVSFLPHANSH
jgi:putative phosphoribosyl transferase